MKIGIYDIETSGFYADSAIMLCISVLDYQTGKVRTLRADKYKSWHTGKSNNKDIVRDALELLAEYDILVHHNGERFDKAFLTTKGIQYHLDKQVRALRRCKTVDPVIISRRRLKLGRNSLASIIATFDIAHKKTPLELMAWMRAAYDSCRVSMNKIVVHCEADVRSLRDVYDRLRPLIDRIDTGGSHT